MRAIVTVDRPECFSGSPDLADAVAEIVSMLQPSASFTKLVEGAGSWTVRRREVGRPFYCAVLEGAFRLHVPGQTGLVLSAGDFLLIPFARSFTTTSLDRLAADRQETVPIEREPGLFRLGDANGPADMRKLIGYGHFASADTDMLVSLLPPVVHLRGEVRLTTLVRLLDEEARAARPARDVVLTRLLELLLIEGLRASAASSAPPGLLRGLADPRLAVALRRIHEAPAASWTVALLAAEAGLSRSAFFDRFRRTVGCAPTQYLLRWRMAIAARLLRDAPIAEVARRVGYGSASAFTVAFKNHSGSSPGKYRRSEARNDRSW